MPAPHCRNGSCRYVRALRCTNFWLFPPNFWDACFLINCYLRCRDVWFCPFGYLSLFLHLHNGVKFFLKEHLIFMPQYIFFKHFQETFASLLSCEKVQAKKENNNTVWENKSFHYAIRRPAEGHQETNLSFKKGCIENTL